MGRHNLDDNLSVINSTMDPSFLVPLAHNQKTQISNGVLYDSFRQYFLNPTLLAPGDSVGEPDSTLQNFNGPALDYLDSSSFTDTKKGTHSLDMSLNEFTVSMDLHEQAMPSVGSLPQVHLSHAPSFSHCDTLGDISGRNTTIDEVLFIDTIHSAFPETSITGQVHPASLLVESQEDTINWALPSSQYAAVPPVALNLKDTDQDPSKLPLQQSLDNYCTNSSRLVVPPRS